MKALVTGATGFVGSFVVERLLERGHQVTAVARNVERLRVRPWHDRVEFVACDLHRDPPMHILAGHDAVLHLAWPGLPNYRQRFHFEKTLLADYTFLRGLIEHGARHLLVTGTCAEYGLRNGCLREDTPADPENAYAIAKDSLRRFLTTLGKEHPFALQWARLFYVYGPGQNPNSLLATLDRAIADGFPRFDMSAGDQLRDFVHVKDVARGLVALAEHPECTGITNVCTGAPTSVRTLVERHLREVGATMALNLGAFPYPTHEPMAFWGDHSRIAALTEDPRTIDPAPPNSLSRGTQP